MTPRKPPGRRGFRIDPRVQVDPEDLDRLRTINRSVYVSTDGYVYFSTVTTGPVGIHTFLMGRMKAGHDGFRVDHINGDPLDNRRANLRVVRDQVNQINRKHLNRNNKSGYRGVSYMPSSGKWRACITVDRRQIHLGCFSSPEAAHEARREAERQHYPEQCPTAEPWSAPTCPLRMDPSSGT